MLQDQDPDRSLEDYKTAGQTHLTEAAPRPELLGVIVSTHRRRRRCLARYTTRRHGHSDVTGSDVTSPEIARHPRM